MLHIMEKHPECAERKSNYDKVTASVLSFCFLFGPVNCSIITTTTAKLFNSFFVVLQISTSFTVHNAEGNFWRNDRKVCTYLGPTDRQNLSMIITEWTERFFNNQQQNLLTKSKIYLTIFGMLTVFCIF